MEAKKKQYGLILKKKEPEPTALRPRTSVFGDDDDDDDGKVDVSYSKTSATTIRAQKQAERQHEAALAFDPTILDYDKAYEEIEEEKNQKIAEQKAKDKDRKSKYAEAIIKAHKRREIEKQSREERQQQKERVKEGDEFADKETFVTGAYREQMELVQKFREEEAYEAHFNELTSVEKQKVWQSGMQRQILEDIARTGPVEGVKKKERHVRKRLESDSDEEGDAAKETTATKPTTAAAPKKSIYSDDEDGPEFAPPKKNFEGDLKPGLNRVVKRPTGTDKAETKAERLRNRMFTPSPEPSDDEKDRRRERRRSPDERREERKKDEKKEHKPEVKKKLSPEEIRAARMVKLKAILKQRNGPEEIEVFRQRYIERRDAGIVVPPL